MERNSLVNIAIQAINDFLRTYDDDDMGKSLINMLSEDPIQIYLIIDAYPINGIDYQKMIEAVYDVILYDDMM